MESIFSHLTNSPDLGPGNEKYTKRMYNVYRLDETTALKLLKLGKKFYSLLYKVEKGNDTDLKLVIDDNVTTAELYLTCTRFKLHVDRNSIYCSNVMPGQPQSIAERIINCIEDVRTVMSNALIRYADKDYSEIPFVTSNGIAITHDDYMQHIKIQMQPMDMTLVLGIINYTDTLVLPVLNEIINALDPSDDTVITDASFSFMATMGLPDFPYNASQYGLIKSNSEIQSALDIINNRQPKWIKDSTTLDRLIVGSNLIIRFKRASELYGTQ